MSNSLTQTQISDQHSEITYGSAALGGMLWNDLLCFKPAPEGKDAAHLLEMENSSCLNNYNFLALDSSTGLESYIDGILGLSP